MKKLYWRPQAVSRTALILIAVVSLAGLALVEALKVDKERPYYQEKIAAAERAAAAFDVIYQARLSVEPEVDITTDPAQTGVVGIAMSPVTSISGDLTAKQTSVNPNFAAVIVDMLKRADVKEGDVVAVGCSGSFPALNTCVYAALETLKTQPIVIASASASQWGANVPDLMWLDMESILHQRGVLQTRSVAASIGGYEDRGLGMTEEGQQLVREAINRNNVQFIESAEFETSVEARMKIYQQHAGRKPIKAFINIGGGTVSTGRSLGKKIFHPGLNFRPPGRIQRVDGVAPRFINDGVPVIHLVHVVQLAGRYQLPIAPTTMPEVGDSPVFAGTAYNNWLVTAVLVIIIASLYGFIRSDIGFRILQANGRHKSGGHPEPMV